MFIEKFKNNGVDYLRLVSSRRVTDKQGRKVARKKIKLNIGPLARYDDGGPDYYERLKASFRNGSPLIPELLPFVEVGSKEEVYTLSFHSNSLDCIGHPRHFSDVLLDRVFAELGLASLFATIKYNSKITYDLQGLIRLLVFGRILNPASKYSTALQAGQYYSAAPVDKDYPYHVYDVLDVIQKNKDKIIRRMNSSIAKGWGRDTEVIFYDVTNFYFETGEPDDDVELKGETLKGIRKMGVSKEHRKKPLVQMGLFLDDKGIPISMEMFPGNTLDQATLRPALKSGIDKLGYSRFILIADRGISSYKNVLHLLQAGNGYIVSKSLRKSRHSERQWALDTKGYIWETGDFKYKSRIVERKEKDEYGNTHRFKEQVVCYWSKKFYNREVYKHKTFLEFIEKLKKDPTSFRITQSQSRSLKRFFKKDVVNKETGEILNANQLLTMLDDDKLEEFTELMGYYQIVTSELELDALEVVDKYHGLTQIEDQFRVMKGDLETRPVFVRKPEHIEAHLLICMIALTIIRMIQRRLVTAQGYTKPQGRYWTYGLSGTRVQQALQRWKIDTLPNDYYRFCDIDDSDLLVILNAFEINIPRKLFTVRELQKIKSGISVFV